MSYSVHSTKFCSDMMKRDIWPNLYQKYFWFCSEILLNVLHNMTLIFFGLLSNCFYCDDHSSLSSTTAVQIWIISYSYTSDQSWKCLHCCWNFNTSHSFPYTSHIVSLHFYDIVSVLKPCHPSEFHQNS